MTIPVGLDNIPDSLIRVVKFDSKFEKVYCTFVQICELQSLLIV